MIKTAQKRIDYIKKLDIPIYLVCDGSAPTLLAASILDDYISPENYTLYATYLPCHPEYLKGSLNEYIKKREEEKQEYRIIDCGKSCTPLNKDGKPTKYNEQCYYGACQKIPLTIQKDYAYMHCINVISVAYNYAQIKHCEQFKHFVPNEYGLIKPFGGSDIRSKGHIYSLYLFLNYTTQDIMETAKEYGHIYQTPICWDELDKIAIAEYCRKAGPQKVSETSKAAYLAEFREYREKIFEEISKPKISPDVSNASTGLIGKPIEENISEGALNEI